MQDTHRQPEHTAEPPGSLLGRSVDLTALPLQWLAWSAVVAVALVIRLTGRTNWPLAPEESAIARDAWHLLQGNDLPASAAANPVTVQITALFFFLFGDSDFTARLLPLTAGIGIIATLFWLRHWIGDLPALSVAIVWALSPVMTMSTLRLDGGGLLILASLLIISLVFVMGVETGTGKPLTLGIVLGIAVTAHPLGWLVAPFTLIPALALIRDPRAATRLIYTAAAFVATLIVVSTWFLTRPSGLPEYFSESFGRLWSDHLTGIGTDWPLTIVVLIADEPLALLSAVLALVLVNVRHNWEFSAHPAIVISSATWAIPMLTLGILLDGKGPALYGATLLPLVLLGGLGLSILIDGMRSIRTNRGRLALWALALFALVVAIVRFSDLLRQGPEEQSVAWLLSALTLGLAIILPLLYLVYRLAWGVRSSLLPVGLGMIALVLIVISLRSALLLPMTGIDRPGEVLIAGSSSPAVSQLEQRLRRYSRDVTTYVQDVRDPTGGHGLRIAIDQDVRDPFDWYFRDFPEADVLDNPDDLLTDPALEQPDVILVSQANRDTYLEIASNYPHRSYPVRYTLPDSTESGGYQDMLVSLLNPLEYRGVFNFLLYRDSATPVEFETVTVMLREDHAGPFWGSIPD